MVRGKTQPTVQKVQSVKKGSAKGTPAPSPLQAASRIQGKLLPPSSIPSCCGCGVLVSDDTKALQCDRCVSPHIWKCAECLNLSADVYDHLTSDANVSLRWFCDNCDKAVMDKNYVPSGGQNDKLDQLITVIEKVMDRYENIERKLDNKCDMSDVTKLEERIKLLEDIALKHESDTSHKLDMLNEQLRTSITSCNIERENGISDEEMIKSAVQEEINRKTSEEQDLENRKQNIIIYRVPEKKTDNVSDRKLSDTVFVKDLLDGVFNTKLEDQDIEKIYRLGHWTEDKTRPLLVKFKNYEQKEHVMSNLSNLRQPIDRFKGIGISHDLHPKEREEIKSMVEKAKQEHIANEVDDVGNYRFLVVGKGPRKQVIKHKRKNSSV